MKKNETIKKSHYLRRLLNRLQSLQQTGDWNALPTPKRKEMVRRAKRWYRQLEAADTKVILKPALMSVVAALGLAAGNQAYAQPQFGAVQLNPFGLTSVSGEAKPFLVDIDADGDLDCFVGDNYNAQHNYFENIGTASAPQFDSVQVNPFNLVSTNDYAAPTFADLDGDGDMDMMGGAGYLNLYYFQNVGDSATPNFAPPAIDTFGIDFTGVVYYETKPHLQDMDNDGDFDLFVGVGVGDVLYFQNIGTPTAPAFDTLQTNPFGITAPGGYYVAPTTVDIDNDGDFDLFVTNNSGDVFYYENTGAASAPAFGTPTTNPFGIQQSYYYSGPLFADLDNDGDNDFMVGDGDGMIRYQADTAGGGSTNNAPTLTPPANATGCDSSYVGPFSFTASDPEGNTLTVTATSSNQAVVADANLTVSGTAPNYVVSGSSGQPGTTTITLTADDGALTATGTFDLTVDSCNVSIGESFFVESFDLYPNPASQAINFDLHLLDATQSLTYEVMDLAGRTLLSEKMNRPGDRFTDRIDLSGFASGLYYLKMRTGELQFTRKFRVE